MAKDSKKSDDAASEILRASGPPLLTPQHAHVAADLAKIATGKKLSPVLLVRGNINACVAPQIADGYHRVCASNLTDGNTPVPVRLADPGTRVPAGADTR